MNISLYPLKLFFSQKVVLVTTIVSLIINMSMWAYIVIVLPPTGETVFLHYNILFGVDLVGPWWRLLVLPMVGLAIVSTNLILSWVLYTFDRLITVVLMYSAVLMQLLLALATYHIVFLNN